MHGDISQTKREKTMQRFKEGKFKCLVATDVAARGLDVPNVELVIQIEPPREVETYIHRSGRTARAGAKGICITFYTSKTEHLVEKIEDQAGIKLTRIEVPQPRDFSKGNTGSKTMKNFNNGDFNTGWGSNSKGRADYRDGGNYRGGHGHQYDTRN
jgi:ATP-dependent RNA helicase DDX21